MDILGIKIIVLLLIGGIKFASGMLPLFLLPRLKTIGIKKRRLDKIMAGILCVGGGALLATVFVHMLPEVRETLRTAMKRLEGEEEGHEGHEDHEGHEGHDHDDHGYPFAELLTCAGFFAIYLIEAVVHKVFLSVHGHKGHSHGGGGGGHGHSHAVPAHMLTDEDPAAAAAGSSAHNDKDPEKYAVSTPNGSDSGVDNPVFRAENESVSAKSTPEMNGGVKTTMTRLTSPSNRPEMAEHPDAMNSGAGTASKSSGLFKTSGTDGSDKNVYNVSSATLTSYTTYSSNGDVSGGAMSVSGPESLDDVSLPNHLGKPELKSGGKSHKNASVRERKMLFSLRNFLIILALSIHSIFEGMAVGLQLRPVDVWKLLVAIGIHDTAIHFCIGMEMFAGGIKRLHITAYFATLGIVTPIGVVIGILATYDVTSGGSAGQDLVIAILQGLAGGTLLYITFYEVLDREKLGKNGMTGLTGCLLLVAGFAGMAGLEAVGGHSHGVPANPESLNGDHHGHSHGGHETTDSSHEHDHHDHGHPKSSEQFLKNLRDSLLKYKEDHDHEENDDHDHDHDDHDHDHGDHNHDHDDLEDHDHEDQNHSHHDHDHDHGIHDHDHNDHNHGHDDHEDHDHDDHDHDHDDHDHDHDDHDHEDEDHDHEHEDHDGDHEDYYNDHDHDHEHEDHDHDHDGHNHDHEHVDGDHKHR